MSQRRSALLADVRDNLTVRMMRNERICLLNAIMINVDVLTPALSKSLPGVLLIDNVIVVDQKQLPYTSRTRTRRHWLMSVSPLLWMSLLTTAVRFVPSVSIAQQFFIGERLTKSSTSNPRFGLCCGDGKIKLWTVPDQPEPLAHRLTLSLPIPLKLYTLPYWCSQSARLSKIKNGGLHQYGTEPFEQQQFGTAGDEGVNNSNFSNIFRYTMKRKCNSGETQIQIGHSDYNLCDKMPCSSDTRLPV